MAVFIKKAGDIMAEMGFRKEAPDSVKEAFLKYLIQSATGAVVQTPSEMKTALGPVEKPSEPTQLSFDLDQDVGKNSKKVS